MSQSDEVTEIVASEPVVPLQSAKYWLKVSHFQAQRALEAHITNALDWRQKMEAQFLLTATQKARRWFKISLENGALNSPNREYIQAFLNATSTAKDLRDVFEHDDEYDLGTGRSPDRAFAVHSHDGDQYRVNHRITIMYRDDGRPIGDLSNTEGLKILLGGRVDLVSIFSITDQLMQQLGE